MIKYYLNKIITFCLLFLSDIIGLYFLLIMSWLIRNLSIDLGIIYTNNIVSFYHLNHYYFPLIGLTILVFIYQSLYFLRNSFYNEYKKIIKSSLMLIIFWGFLVSTLKMGTIYSRFISFSFIGFLIIIFPFYRKIVKIILYNLKIWSKDVIVIGDYFPKTLKNLLSDKVLGYKSKYYSVKNVDEILETLDQLPLKSVSTDLILVFKTIKIEKLENIIKNIEFNYETIRIFSSLSKFLNYIFFIETNLPTNFFLVKRNLLKPYNRILKRLFDIFISIVLSLLFFPLFFIIFIILLIINKGKVFFIQERVGFKGKVFKLLKFRSMYENSDEILEDYLKNSPEKRKEWQIFRKIKGYDPRVTKIGKILRKLSFDELPQIINIIRGEMSLIGPRPYLKEEILDMDCEGNILHFAKPGLTGLWQVLGRNKVDLENRFFIDEYYIRNWDFWMDLFILFRTPFSIYKGY